MLAIHSARFNFIWLAVVGLFVGTMAVLYNGGVIGQPATRFAQVVGAVPEALSATGDKTNEGLLRQTARHLSKMERGTSIGGFPGFEPPKDDKEYQRKIKEGNYSAQNVNDWVKDISKSLEQVAKKNPGKSLEKILQEQGKTRIQIDEFLDAVRNAQYRARSMEGTGVNTQTIE